MDEFEKAHAKWIIEFTNKYGELPDCAENGHFAKEWFEQDFKYRECINAERQIQDQLREIIELRTENKRLRDVLEKIITNEKPTDEEWIDFVFDTAIEVLEGEEE